MLKKIVFMIFGCSCVIIALLTALETRKFLEIAASADGVITALNAGPMHPQIEFISRTGEKITFPQGGLVFVYQVGDKVRVLYDVSNPNITARIGSFGAIWFRTIIFAFLSVLFIAISFL